MDEEMIDYDEMDMSEKTIRYLLAEIPKQL